MHWADPAGSWRGGIKVSVRLDLLLVRAGYFSARQRAKEAVLEGRVFVDGQLAPKPGALVGNESRITVLGSDLPYPSRAGRKLEWALERFSLKVAGAVALDVGASTGGFTSCLLQRGARRVYAVDVGRDQLASELRDDPRVVVMEQTNIRDLLLEHLGEPVDLATIDVSFISLRKVFPAVSPLLTVAGKVVALIKPQFETGGAGLNKKGVITDRRIHSQFVPALIESLQKEDLALKSFAFSPLKGVAGNQEYLAYFKKGERRRDNIQALIEKTIEEGWAYHRNKEES